MSRAAGARRMDLVRSVVRGYTRLVRPEPEELSRLAQVMRVRPSVFEVWAFGVGRKSVTDAARAVAEVRELSDAIAARARAEFAPRRLSVLDFSERSVVTRPRPRACHTPARRPRPNCRRRPGRTPSRSRT
jgi:hypothetical protein